MTPHVSLEDFAERPELLEESCRKEEEEVERPKLEELAVEVYLLELLEPDATGEPHLNG